MSTFLTKLPSILAFLVGAMSIVAGGMVMRGWRPCIVQKPQPTENRAKKVANRPLLIPRMVFENGELWEFN